MIALGEGPITPLAIAPGRGDDYLFALNACALARRGPRTSGRSRR